MDAPFILSPSQLFALLPAREASKDRLLPYIRGTTFCWNFEGMCCHGSLVLSLRDSAGEFHCSLQQAFGGGGDCALRSSLEPEAWGMEGRLAGSVQVCGGDGKWGQGALCGESL